MTRKMAVLAATKADIDEAVGLLRESTKADLDEAIGLVRSDLKEDIGFVRRDLESKATKVDLESMHRGLALQIERQQNEARASEDRMVQKMSSLNSQVMQAIDSFAGKAQNSERAMTLHGRELTDVHVGLREHERRITALESKPGS